MMLLAVVTTGTMSGRVTLGEADEGVLIGRDVLDLIGVRDGDAIEIHTDGRMLVLLPIGTDHGGQQDEAEARQ